MKSAEPRLVYDPREYEPAYVSALEMSGGTSARLDFSYFGALTELPDHQHVPVGDITDEVKSGVIEVKTKADLASSMTSGRLSWAIWHMKLLVLAGKVNAFAVLIRDINAGMHENARGSYLIARRALARWQQRFGFSVLISEDVDDTIEIAKSFLRECREPKVPVIPEPIIKKEYLDYNITVKALMLIKGIGVELAIQLAQKYTLWDIIVDAHEMDVDALCAQYSQDFNFGGKENKRLRAIWEAFHDMKRYQRPA